MLNQLRPAIVILLLLSALTGLAYPLAVTGVAQALLKAPADGSLVLRDGKVVGSSLIGQNFTTDRYFHGRLSATSDTDPKDATKTIDAPYNAANSTGSNLGPTSQKLVDRVKASVAALGGSPQAPVPADAVTTSASGLDPDISAAYAAFQAARVAGARKVPVDQVKALIADQTHGPGAATVNVLALNLALDRAAPLAAASPEAAPAEKAASKTP